MSEQAAARGQPEDRDRRDVQPEGAPDHPDDAGSGGNPAAGSRSPALQRERQRRGQPVPAGHRREGLRTPTRTPTTSTASGSPRRTADIPDLLRLRLARNHRGRDGRHRSIADDSRRDAQSRHQARHEPVPGLGSRSVHGNRRVGLRRRGRRSALERPSVVLGRLRARLPAGPDDPQCRRPPGGPGLPADRRALEREVERPARCRQFARAVLPGLRQDKPGK